MIEFWKECEGQVIDGIYDLGKWVCGSETSGVFRTEYAAADGKRPAAIKIIKADPETAETQISDWKLASKLYHPRLLRLFAAGRCALRDIPMIYVVTEYAEDDLSKVLAHRPLTNVEAREVLEGALGALGYLHANNFVHGNFKPANIMSVDDQLKMSSDSLRRIAERNDVPTGMGPYDPPERILSPAADVWALGITLFEALTQRRPVLAGTAESIPPDVPPPFLEIVRHCLQRDPQARWTVPEIADRLRSPDPAPIQPITSVQPTGHILRSSHALALSAALVLALLAMLFLRKPQPASGTSEPAAAPPAATSPAPGTEPAKPTPIPEPAIEMEKEPALSAKPEPKKKRRQRRRRRKQTNAPQESTTEGARP